MSIFKKTENMSPTQICPVCGSAPEIEVVQIDNGYVATVYCDINNRTSHIHACVFGKTDERALKSVIELWYERCRIGKEYLDANNNS